MKANFLRSALLMSLLTTAAPAQTINWGSEVFSTLVDSHGAELGLNSTYTFQLGAFNTGFTPSQSNLLQWFGNWRVFDSADYSRDSDYFTATVDMANDGSSLSEDRTDSLPFLNVPAYIWIRNSTTAGSDSTEWLLLRGSNWTFPTTASIDCCDPALPIEWSVSDLSRSDLPLYGSQGGTDGTGGYNAPTGQISGVISTPQSGAYLQTATFAGVPELSSSVLVLILGVLGLTDRRRSWRA